MHLKFLSSREGEERRWRLLLLVKGCRRAAAMEWLCGSDGGEGTASFLGFLARATGCFPLSLASPSSVSVLALQAGPCPPQWGCVARYLPDSRCRKKDMPGVCKVPFQCGFGPGHAWHTADALHE